MSETYYQFADHYHRLLKEIEISNENKNLNGLKADNLDEKDHNLDDDDEPKPSRKERSDEAKKMELQLSEKSNFQEKIPRKFSEKKSNNLNETKN